MSFWTDDLPMMFADFGQTVTLRNGGKFTALYEAPFLGVGDVPVESQGPSLTCQATDVADLAHGDSLTIGGQGYVVRGIEPDGVGVTVLRLERA